MDFNTDNLIMLLDEMEQPSSFLRDLFFPDIEEFTEEKVSFDKIEAMRGLAPFVSPLVAGQVQKSRGGTSVSIEPAYVKPKHAVTPKSSFKRRPGESAKRPSTPMQRYLAAVMDNLVIEEQSITRREEWMAIEILLNGKVVLTGENYDSREVDFSRKSDHRINLTGNSSWGKDGVSPFKNLRSWIQMMHTSAKIHPTHVIVDPLAGDDLVNDPELHKILDNRQSTPVDINILGSATGAEDHKVVKIGSFGSTSIYQYQDFYTDDKGKEHGFMPENTVLIGSPRAARGVRCYGGIQDRKSGLVARARFPKTWYQDDPGVDMTMTQSAPILALGNINATMAITTK